MLCYSRRPVHHGEKLVSDEILPLIINRVDKPQNSEARMGEKGGVGDIIPGVFAEMKTDLQTLLNIVDAK